MLKRSIATTTIAALALAAGALGNAAAGETEATSSGKSKKTFKPKQFTGHWEGKWTNHTFDTSGASTMDLKVKGKGKKQKFIGTLDLAGTAFGCPDPKPRTVKMKKGKGDNTWNKKGFQIGYDNGFGPISFVYKAKKQKVTGSGTSPCASDITYTFDGKMTKKKLTGDTEIFLEGDPFANSSLKVTKQK